MNHPPTLHEVSHSGVAGRLTALRRWRCARGFNQADLAAAAGLTQAAISELEQGHRVPSLRTVARLVAALDVPLAQLLQVEVPKALPREAADRIASAIIEGTGSVRAGERRMVDHMAGLAIQKLRAHRVPGRRRVSGRRWAAARRAMWVTGIYGRSIQEQVLRRVDVLLAMRGAR